MAHLKDGDERFQQSVLIRRIIRELIPYLLRTKAGGVVSINGQRGVMRQQNT